MDLRTYPLKLFDFNKLSKNAILFLFFIFYFGYNLIILVINHLYNIFLKSCQLLSNSSFKNRVLNEKQCQYVSGDFVVEHETLREVVVEDAAQHYHAVNYGPVVHQGFLVEMVVVKAAHVIYCVA